MAAEAPVYDLILLLDTTIEQERRDKILANVEDAIDAAASSSAATTGATATTVYEVRKHGRGRLPPDPVPRRRPTLLEQLDHNLKITDGILRFRIIKLRPGTPPPPDLRPRPWRAVAAPPPRPRPNELRLSEPAAAHRRARPPAPRRPSRRLRDGSVKKSSQSATPRR